MIAKSCTKDSALKAYKKPDTDSARHCRLREPLMISEWTGIIWEDGMESCRSEAK